MNSRVAELFRKIHVRERTGVLGYYRGSVHRDMLFRHGGVVATRSTVTDDRLGEVMVRHGRITAQHLADASVLVKGGRRLGDALVELRIVRPEEIEPFVRLQLLEVSRSVLTETPHRLTFKKQDVTPVISGLSVTQILMDTARHTAEIGPFVDVLLRQDKYLILRKDGLRWMNELSLTPQEAFLLSRINCDEPARNVFSLSPLSESETARTLLGLMHAGIVEIGSRAEHVRAR